MPRLSDKHIAAIRAAAEDNEQTYGFGDVILVCDELQERRKNGENVPTPVLGDRLLERFQEGSNVSDSTAAALIPYLQGKPHKRTWEVPDEVTNATLMDELIKRVNDNEAISDALVLALFHAMQRQGYFQTITFVNRKALETVVHALACTEHPHIVRELQVTRNLPVAEGEPLNPINQLIQDARNAST